MEKTVAGGDASTDSSGIVEKQEKPVESENVEVSNGKVSYESYHKLLTEKKRFEKRDEELKELRQYRLENENRKKLEEEQKLQQQGNWQKLLEDREKELQREREEKEQLFRKITDSLKFSELRKALPGHLDEKFLPLVNLDEIELDESGRPDKASVEKHAKVLLKNFGTSILVTSNGARLPQDGIRGSEKSLTYEEWLKLPASEMRKRQKEVKSNTRRD